jgi:hypothetical protein
MNVKKPKFEIDNTKYVDAINFSIHDEEWLNIAFSQKENLLAVTNQIVKSDLSVATNKFIYKNDLSKILQNKKDTVIREEIVDILFKNYSYESKKLILENIKRKTNHNAKIVESLLNEYGDKTRDVFTGIIKPHPTDIKETTTPLKRFVVVVSQDVMFEVLLTNSGLNVLTQNENLDPINDYFRERSLNKNILRCYIDKQIVTPEVEKEIKNKLLYVKETKLPANFVFKNPSDYRLTIRESSVCLMEDNCYYSIDSQPIRIKFIQRESK